MITRLSGAILCFALALPAGAQTPAARAAAEAARWDARFEAVAAYDPLARERLRDSDGSWRVPKRATENVLSTLAPEIRRVATLYQVDPRAIVGAILTEHSLNVQMDDDFQDWLVSSGILSTGEIGGRPMSIGFGQVLMPTARSVEGLAARIEHRPRRSDNEIAQALVVPRDAIRYVAAVIRQAQDTYTAAGFDISHDPAMLATVYNLGQPLQRAAAARAAGRTPRINYFGFFMEHYMSRIERITRSGAGITGGTTLAEGGASATSAAAPEAKTPPTALPAISTTPPAVEPQRVITREIRLLVSPPTCSTSGVGGLSEYNRINTLSTYTGSGRAAVGGRYAVVSPGLGCNMEPHTLIRTEDGTVGWVANDVLQARSEERMLPIRACTPTVNAACIRLVERAIGNQRIGGSAEGSMAVRIVGSGPGLRWQNPFFLNNSDGTQPTTPTTRGAPLNRRTITPEEAAHLVGALRSRVQQVHAFLNQRGAYVGFSAWNTTWNPYAMVSSDVDNAISLLDTCTPTAGGGAPSSDCVADVDAINRFLVFELRPEPTFTYLTEVALLCRMAVSSDLRQELAPAVEPLRRELARLITPCQTLVNGKILSTANFNGIMNHINGDIEGDEDLERLRRIFSELGTDCTNIGLAITGAVLTGHQGENFIDCAWGFGQGGYQLDTQTFPLDRLRALLITAEDQDQFISGVLRHAVPDYIFNNSRARRVAPPALNFTYNPFETAELIERILRNRCVKAVYVPDPWLMRRLRSQTRVIYRPMTEEDRFTVDVGTTTCTERSTAR